MELPNVPSPEPIAVTSSSAVADPVAAAAQTKRKRARSAKAAVPKDEQVEQAVIIQTVRMSTGGMPKRQRKSRSRARAQSVPSNKNIETADFVGENSLTDPPYIPTSDVDMYSKVKSKSRSGSVHNSSRSASISNESNRNTPTKEIVTNGHSSQHNNNNIDSQVTKKASALQPHKADSRIPLFPTPEDDETPKPTECRDPRLMRTSTPNPSAVPMTSIPPGLSEIKLTQREQNNNNNKIPESNEDRIKRLYKRFKIRQCSVSVAIQAELWRSKKGRQWIKAKNAMFDSSPSPPEKKKKRPTKKKIAKAGPKIRMTKTIKPKKKSKKSDKANQLPSPVEVDPVDDEQFITIIDPEVPTAAMHETIETTSEFFVQAHSLGFDTPHDSDQMLEVPEIQ